MKELRHRERGANPVPDAAMVATIAAGILVSWMTGKGLALPIHIAGAATMLGIAFTLSRLSQGVYPGDAGCLPLAAVPLLMIGGAAGARLLAQRSGLTHSAVAWTMLAGMAVPALLGCGLVRLLGKRRRC